MQDPRINNLTFNQWCEQAGYMPNIHERERLWVHWLAGHDPKQHQRKSNCVGRCAALSVELELAQAKIKRLERIEAVVKSAVTRFNAANYDPNVWLAALKKEINQ